MVTKAAKLASEKTVSSSLLPVVLMFAGCSATPMTAEEKEHKYFQTYEQWQFCHQAYSQSRANWVSQLSTVKVKMSGQMLPAYHDLRRDLVANKCDTVLRQVGYIE